MVEAHARTELDHPRGFGGCQRIDRNAQMRRCAEKQRGVAHRFGRRDEQQPLSLGSGSDWMRRTKLSSIWPAERRPAEFQNPPASSAAETFRGTSSSASGMPRVSATMRSRTRGSIPPTITDSSSSRASPSDRPLITSSGSPANASAPPFADREDQCDRLGHQAARDEGKCLHRHLVEPLRVVDDAEQGLVIGGGRHQAQHCQTDQETVRGRPDAAAERHGQCLALRFRQFVDVIHQRRAQLLQAGECELHIGLHACHVD